MEDRLVVNINRNCLITHTLIVVCLTSLNSAAEIPNDTNSKVTDVTKTNTVRFYKENRHQQNIRIYPSKSKTNESGCHNFKRSRRIAKIIQIGYESCSIYTQKNCAPDSAIKANHSGQDTYAQQLTEGHGWLPKPQSEKDNRGVKLRSWSCQ